MKKLLLVGLLVSAAFIGKAQQVEIIPKAGVNFAKQAISNLNNEKTKVAFQGGVAFNIQAGKSDFSIQPELNFIGKGTRLKTGALKTNLSMNYLELPVLAKYSFGPVYINAGPSIAMSIDGKEKIARAYAQELKRFDFGLQMGAGVALPVGTGKVIIDGRYGLGLSNIANVGSIKNRGIMASIGYAIPL